MNEKLFMAYNQHGRPLMDYPTTDRRAAEDEAYFYSRNTGNQSTVSEVKAGHSEIRATGFCL